MSELPILDAIFAQAIGTAVALRSKMSRKVEPERTVVVEGDEPFLSYHDPEALPTTLGMSEMTEHEARQEHGAVPCHTCFEIDDPTYNFPYMKGVEDSE